MSSWFYVENDNRKGPVAGDVIEQMIASGQITPNTLVWQDGMADWTAASTQFDFSNTPPNVPPAYGANMGDETGDGQSTGPDGLYKGAPSRGFGEAVTVCFSKYAEFSGRASRSEFWYWVLFSLIAGFVTGFIDGLFFPSNDLMPVNLLFSLGTFIPSLSVGARRLHDINRSGWWQILPIVNIIFWCQKGETGPNHYG